MTGAEGEVVASVVFRAVWLRGAALKDQVLANPSSHCVMDFSVSSLEFQMATCGASAALSVCEAVPQVHCPVLGAGTLCRATQSPLPGEGT